MDSIGRNWKRVASVIIAGAVLLFGTLWFDGARASRQSIPVVPSAAPTAPAVADPQPQAGDDESLSNEVGDFQQLG